MWKKKNRTQLFPVPEHHPAEWVDRANEQHIQVTNDVLRIATEQLTELLSATTPEEDYSDFVASNGWLNRVKHHHRFREVLFFFNRPFCIVGIIYESRC